MTSRLAKVLVLVGGLTVVGIWQGYAQSSNSSPQPTAKPAHSQTLTTQEKEAQKHYLVAVEALKNNDLTTALRELKAAAELAPKKALIWYNLAVVESKTDDSAQAAKDLQKAESLGLPKNLQSEGDELSAKLTYKTENSVKGGADQPNKPAAQPAETGPTLSETLEFLARILQENEARGTARRALSDYRRYAQDRFVFNSPNQCVFSWDNVLHGHYADGTPPVQRGQTEFDNRNREFVSLKDVLLSDVKVMDFRAFAISQVGGPYVGNIDRGDDVHYDGYVLLVKHADTGYNRPQIPNPYNVVGSFHYPNEAFFFTSVDDANRAQKAIIHAATLCGAKADVF